MIHANCTIDLFGNVGAKPALYRRDIESDLRDIHHEMLEKLDPKQKENKAIMLPEILDDFQHYCQEYVVNYFQLLESQEPDDCQKAICPPMFDDTYVCIFPAYSVGKVELNCPIAQFGEAWSYCYDNGHWATPNGAAAIITDCKIEEYWDTEKTHLRWFETIILRDL